MAVIFEGQQYLTVNEVQGHIQLATTELGRQHAAAAASYLRQTQGLYKPSKDALQAAFGKDVIKDDPSNISGMSYTAVALGIIFADPQKKALYDKILTNPATAGPSVTDLGTLKQSIAAKLPAIESRGSLIFEIEFLTNDVWPVAGNTTVGPAPPVTVPTPVQSGEEGGEFDPTVPTPNTELPGGIPDSLPDNGTTAGQGTGENGEAPTPVQPGGAAGESGGTNTPSTPEDGASNQAGGSNPVYDDDGKPLNDAARQAEARANAGGSSPVSGQGSGPKRFDTGLTKQEITINPQPNILDKFSSYTYNIALYVMNIETYVEMLKAPKTASSMPKTLVMRTGGVGLDNSRSRDHPFDVDFYIDDLKLTTIGAAPSQATANTSVVNISFQVTEPRGVTLLERLRDLAKQMLPPGESYMNVPYLLEIKFVGYTETGAPVRASAEMAPKYIPIKIIDFSFNITESGSIYNLKAVPFNHSVFQQVQSTIPVDIQLKAGTLKDIFENQQPIAKYDLDTGKPLNEAGRQAEARADAGEFGNVTTEKLSLAQAINNYEKSKTKTTRRTIKSEGDSKKEAKAQIEIVPPSAELADRVKFVVDQSFAEAILTPTSNDSTNTPTKVDPKTGKFRNYVDSLRGNVKIDKKNGMFRINAGTNITKLMNTLIVQSSYVSNNIIEKMDESNNHGKGINWFQIIPRIEKSLGWDKKAGRYKFEYAYDILPRKMHYSAFPFVDKSMPNGKGIHKVYNYIFTGENTQVLDFKLRFNVAYIQTMSQGSGQSKVGDKLPENAFNPGTKELVTSNEGSHNTPAQTIKKVRAKDLFSDIMNSGVDLITADIDIVGDPAYLPTGDFFMDKQYGDSPSMYMTAFYPDGTINLTLSPPYVQMNLKTPTDYDDVTGLMDPNQTGRYKSSEFNGVYRVLDTESTFSGGVFSQRLSVVRAPLQPVVVRGKATLSRDPKVAQNIERMVTLTDLGSKLSPHLNNTIKEFVPSNVARLAGELSNVQRRLEKGLTEIPFDAMASRLQNLPLALQKQFQQQLEDLPNTTRQINTDPIDHDIIEHT
jgi:hypothetical protein